MNNKPIETTYDCKAYIANFGNYKVNLVDLSTLYVFTSILEINIVFK